MLGDSRLSEANKSVSLRTLVVPRSVLHEFSTGSITMSLFLFACLMFQVFVDVTPISTRQVARSRREFTTFSQLSFPYTEPSPAPDADKQNVTWLMPGCGALEVNSANSRRRSKRMVGGEPSKKGQWPWMVAIHNFVDGNICGGILISQQHVLTAAHCVHYVPADGLEVTLGVNDLYAEDALYSNVSFVHIHEKYDRKTIKNDIAILTLSEKVPFEQRISSICMPDPNEKMDNVMAVVAGWGATYFGGPVSDILYHVSLPIWKQSKCKEIIDRKTRLTISPSQLCAGYLHAGKDACQGDSGGPLMYQSASGQWFVAGIVSAGRKCGDGGIPGIYTRVSHYLKWIRSITDS